MSEKGKHGADHGLLIKDHLTIHPPVDHPVVRIFGDHEVPRAQVSSTVSVMDHGPWKLEKICVIPQEDVLLAGSVFLVHDHGLYRSRSKSVGRTRLRSLETVEAGSMPMAMASRL